MRILSIISVLVAGLATTVLSAQPTPRQTVVELKKSAVASVSWNETTIDVGEVEQGKPVDAIFELSNEGNVPLIITKVQTSCGCTVSEFENEPILPGETSTIKATYNAKAKGSFAKTITVFANIESGTKHLIIKGKVK